MPTWGWFTLFLFYLFIDQLIDYSRRMKGGVQIRDLWLANDPEFVRDVEHAVAEAARRDINRQLQDKTA